MSNRSPAWDDLNDAEDIWRSDEENDMGYVCEHCGHIPSFSELKSGTCSCRRNQT